MRIPTLSVVPQSNSIQFLCKYIVMYQLDSKNLNFNIFGVFQKNEYVLGYEDFVDIFGVITKLD